MTKLFWDTNVFLDAMLQNREFKEAPISILNSCSNGEILGYTSGISFANITYFLQKATTSNADILLRQILKSVQIITLEKEDFAKALSYKFKDIEDAYQLVAAQKVTDVEFLITRNIKDYKQSPIPIVTPEQYEKQGY